MGTSLLSRPEAERRAIGAAILDAKARAELVTRVSPNDFENEYYRIGFIAIQKLMSSGKEIDLFTIHSELLNTGAPSDVVVELSRTVDEIPDPALIAEYCTAVLDAATRRKVYTLGRDLSLLAGDTNSIEKAVEQYATELIESASRISASDTVQLGAVGESEVGQLDRPRSGVVSPYPSINADIGSFEADQLIIIGARPGVGKTAFGIQLAGFAASEIGKSVLYVSAEMSRQAIWRRLVYQHLGIAPVKQASGALNKDERDAITDFAITVKDNGWPLYIMDGGEMSFPAIYGRAKAMSMSGNLDMVIVDYLQLLSMSGSGDNRALQIAELTASLKRMSRQLQVPVIAMSQLNRSMEREGDGREPRLHDLRESGAIEQDADLVFFIHRKTEGLSVDVGRATIILAKHRQGPTARYKCNYSSENGKFFNIVRA